MKNILQRAASTHPPTWELPLVACRALGISSEKAVPASAALACAHISIILVDDMLDEGPRGEYHRIGNGRAANLAVALQAAGVEALFEGRNQCKDPERSDKEFGSNDVFYCIRSGTGYPQPS